MKHLATSHRQQRGFSLVSAIFLIVVMATLAGYMVSMYAAQRTTTDYALQGARAYNAAYSGVQWGVWQALQNGNTCIAATPFTVGNFDVNVNCTFSRHLEGGDPLNNCTWLFVISATATYSTFGQEDRISRQVETVVANIGQPIPPGPGGCS